VLGTWWLIKGDKMEAEKRRRNLFSAGILLFLLALITGMIFPVLANPRMGLSAHLVGLLGGLFLVALGAIWPEKDLPPRLDTAAFRLVIFAAYANLCTTFLAAAFATNRLTPLAGSGHLAQAWQENLVTFGLVSSSIAMVTVCILVLWGLRRRAAA
jgi:hydroxylaminobenzene mutase